MTTIGILTKPLLSHTSPLIEALLDWLRRRHKTALLSAAPGADDRDARRHIDAQIAAAADLVLVLGGDGTMLRAARLVEQRAVPILGINLGGLGFLTESAVDEMYDSLDKVFAQAFYLDLRLRLHARVRDAGGRQRTETALNDAVIGKEAPGRMLSTTIHVDTHFVTTLRGDGVIIASPTGSTAYSMSAGGPILDPSLDVLLLTPVAPHTLTHRPLLIPGRCALEIHVAGGGTVTFDGQTGIPIDRGDTLAIGASPHKTRLVRFPDRTYYDRLRTQLKWGDG